LAFFDFVGVKKNENRQKSRDIGVVHSTPKYCSTLPVELQHYGFEDTRYYYSAQYLVLYFSFLLCVE
jgi:hypothetical protein